MLFLSFTLTLLISQVAAAPLESRSPQNPRSVSGECQNAQLNANAILPDAINALREVASGLTAGSLQTAVKETQSGLEKALPGLGRVTQSVESGTGTKLDDINSLAEGLVTAELAFASVKDSFDDSDSAAVRAKVTLDQALAAGQAVINSCV